MIHYAHKIRTLIIFLVFCVWYAIIVIRLYHTQIREHQFYQELASQQYTITVTTLPPRAPIFDRTHKHYLALNKECVSAFLLPNKLLNKPAVETFLHTHFPHAAQRLAQHPDKEFMFIKRKLTDQQLQNIHDAQLPDIKLLAEPSRYYPLSCAMPLIGATDIDTQGIAGIELACNHHLAGSSSAYYLEKDARSGYFCFAKQTTIEGIQPTPISLTIDGDLQFLAHQELEATMTQFQAQEGAVLVINPENGDILALSSISSESDPTKNLAHCIPLTESYELGSVIKIFAALASLEEGVVTSDELIDCKGAKTAYIDGRRINTVRAHGIIPFTEVIAKSNNIGMAIVAKRLNEKLYDHYLRLGFGQKIDIPFPAQAKGFVNPPHAWSKQSIISLSYGYEISATLVQLARALCIIARDGYMIPLRLILSPTPKTPVVAENQQLYTPESIKIIKHILEETTLHGTAHRAAIKGYRVMSKTGTANMLVNGAYDNTKNLFTCAGIVEKDTYQRVIVVFIKEAISNQDHVLAATVAAPLFERVAERMLIHERIIG